MNWVGLLRSVTISVAAGLLFPAWALDDGAPFGFAWGPLDKIPRPSLALKDANVTVLHYRPDRLQGSAMPDTEVVSLDVCSSEGLQQVSSATRPLSSNDAATKFAQVVAIGVRRYGESKPTPDGGLTWQNGRVEVMSIAQPDGKHRILMVSRGPEFAACAAEHDAASDQSLRARWLHRPELPN